MVSYGRAATAALAARIRAAKAAGHPLDPVTVLVPSNTAGLSARRLLAVGDQARGLEPTNLANVSFVTPFRLAELVAAGSLSDRRPLTNPVLAAAVRSALRDAPGMFAPVAGHQATQAAVISVYSELSRAHPDTRAGIAAASRRGAEVVRLVDEVRRRLADFADEDDLAAAATARLHKDAGAAAPLGTLIWHLPDRLTPAMSSLVGAALTAAPAAAVVLALTGVPAADAAVLATVGAAGVEVDGVGGPVTADIVPATAARIVSATDADEEVRHVVREVAALADAGVPLDRIAIFRPSAVAYARTLDEQLDGAGIPHNGPSARRLADSAAGRALLGALALPGNHNGWGRGDVMALLAEAPVRDASGDPVPTRRWDDLSRAAGVVGGIDDWREKLAHLERTLTIAIDELVANPGDQPEWKVDGKRRDLEATSALAAFVDGLDAAIAAVQDAATWAGRAAAAHALLEQLLGPEHRRTRWPDVEVTAAQLVDAALTRLGALDDIDPHPTFVDFTLALASELDAPLGRTGRFGEGVLVAPLASAAGHDLDAVFILGMAEGTCPGFRRDDALLPDTDRQRQRTPGELLTQDERLHAQHRSLLAALAAAPPERRTLLFPRGDLRGRRDRLPSRWLLNSASALAGHRIHSSDVARQVDGVIHVVHSYEHGVSTAATHGSIVERDVALLRAAPDPAAHPLAAAILGRGLLARQARLSPEFTEWDGNLAGAEVVSPFQGKPFSASRLEAWAKCPFQYFLGSVLGLGERDTPERVVEISAAERGTLVHRVLEDFIAEVLVRPEGKPAPDQAWTDDDRTRLHELAGEAFADVEARGLTGRPLTWRRTKDAVRSDLDLFLVKDDAHRMAQAVRPKRAEMAFGMNGAPNVAITLPSGRTLHFRGKADRVDEGDDGSLVVLDYKTGKGDGYKDLAKDPVKAGQVLQLGIYAEAARAVVVGGEPVPVASFYWMVSDKGGFAQYGYQWDGEPRARFLEAVDTIAEGIERGIFPALPGDYNPFWSSYENCSWCAFDRICPRDRDDHQRAKAVAPELALLGRLQPPSEDAQ